MFIMSMHADDLKLMSVTKSLNDAARLQSDLDALSAWCEANPLGLNIEKCKVMTFHKTRSPVRFRYSIHEVALVRVIC